MSASNMLLFVTAIAALAAAILAWLVIDIGIGTMRRYRAHFTERTRFQVREFFLFVDPARIFLAHAALMTLGAIVAGLATGSMLVAAAVFIGLALLPRVVYAWLRVRRLRTFEEQLPDALMMLAGALRAGLSLNMAISQLVIEARAPLGQEFTLMLREQRLGVTLEHSLNGLVRRIPTQTTILVVSAMRIATETGGGLAETLERTAHTVRSRLQIEGKIRTLTAQGKLQAWIVGLLPLSLMLVLDHMEPAAMSQLWHTGMGWAALAAIATLEFLGIYVIRRIVAIDV
ncbi:MULTISPECIES: type II secretion system F family protein [unclassified Janthinobacterium]|uniref:type II secretion system F family protein n=1 Tax=unclassified Janthinobacterium TaxID=2610881 RepID=UPI001617A609|nr:MULTISPECIES: type II secretion system F family protein [unclassified Janthinobacterium]MBB5606646.1 tight adherence protein B [Janthinobacterium sp. S3T4]MBB5612304.1 tight adherence protein B [Janthinobacterium sp. S3M3]